MICWRQNIGGQTRELRRTTKQNRMITKEKQKQGCCCRNSLIKMHEYGKPMLYQLAAFS